MSFVVRRKNVISAARSLFFVLLFCLNFNATKKRWQRKRLLSRIMLKNNQSGKWLAIFWASEIRFSAVGGVFLVANFTPTLWLTLIKSWNWPLASIKFHNYLQGVDSLSWSRNCGFLWNLKVHYLIHKILSLDLTLSQMNLIHILLPNFFSINFNKIYA